MSEKIVDISKGNEDLVPGKELIIKYFKEIPDDIFQDYISACDKYVDDILVLKSILASRNKPNLLKHIIDGLNETQLIKFEKIALNLGLKDPIRKIDELIETTFGSVFPDSEGQVKAAELIKKLKNLDIDYELKSNEFADFSRQIRILSHIFCVLKYGRELGDVMIDQLSLAPKGDLDVLLGISSSTIENKESCQYN